MRKNYQTNRKDKMSYRLRTGIVLLAMLFLIGIFPASYSYAQALEAPETSITTDTTNDDPNSTPAQAPSEGEAPPADDSQPEPGSPPNGSSLPTEEEAPAIEDEADDGATAGEDEESAEIHTITFFSDSDMELAALTVEDGAIIDPALIPQVEAALLAGWYPRDTAQAIEDAREEYLAQLEDYLQLLEEDPETEQEPPAPVELESFGPSFNLDAPVYASHQLRAVYNEATLPLDLSLFAAPADLITVAAGDVLVLGRDFTYYLKSNPNIRGSYYQNTKITGPKGGTIVIEVPAGSVAQVGSINAMGGLMITGGGVLKLHGSSGYLLLAIEHLQLTGNTMLDIHSTHPSNPPIAAYNVIIDRGSVLNVMSDSTPVAETMDYLTVYGTLSAYSGGRTTLSALKVVRVDGGQATIVNTRLNGVALDVYGRGPGGGVDPQAGLMVIGGAHVSLDASANSTDTFSSGYYGANLTVAANSTLLVDGYLAINNKIDLEVSGGSSLLVNTRRQHSSFIGLNVQGFNTRISNDSTLVVGIEGAASPTYAYNMNYNNLLSIEDGSSVTLYGHYGYYDSNQEGNRIVVDRSTLLVKSNYVGVYFRHNNPEATNITIKNGSVANLQGVNRALYSGGSVSIEGEGSLLTGNSTIGDVTLPAIYILGNLQMTSGARLELDIPKTTPIRVNGNMMMDNASANLSTSDGNGNALHIRNDLSITNSTLNATSDLGSALYVHINLQAGHGASITAVADNSIGIDSGAIRATDGATLSGISHGQYGLGVYAYYGISAEGEGSYISGLAPAGHGISSDNDILVKNGAHIEGTTETAGQYGIFSSGSITALGGKVTGNAIDWTLLDGTEGGAVISAGQALAGENGFIIENYQYALGFDDEQFTLPFEGLRTLGHYSHYRFTIEGEEGYFTTDPTGISGLMAALPASSTTLTATRTTPADGELVALAGGGTHIITTRPVHLEAAEALPPQTFTVQFDGNGATKEATPSAFTVRQPETTLQALPTPPEKTGSTFAGWNTKADGTGSPFDTTTAVTGNLTVYAQWRAGTASLYQLTFDANGGSGAPSPQKLQGGQLIARPQQGPTKANALFTGWNTKADGSGSSWDFDSSRMPQSNLTLYAMWRAETPTPPAPTPVVPGPVRPTPATPVVTPPTGPAEGPATANPSGGPQATPPQSEEPQAPATTQPEAEAGAEAKDPLTNQMGLGNVPLFGPAGSAWSLLNLILAITGLALSLPLLASLLAKRKALPEGQPQSFRDKTSLLLKLAAILLGPVSGILFLVLEDTSLAMTWITNWTYIILPVFALQLGLAATLLVLRLKQLPKQDISSPDHTAGQPS